MYLSALRSKYLNSIPILLGLIIRLVNIDMPIVGIHSWRQADTAAMARHFALKNTPIWLPQIDWSGATQGYVESEFPIYPYIVGQIYKLFGLNEIFGRSISILFGLLTIFLIIRITTILFNSNAGFWAGIFYSLLPLSVYYSRTFQAESLLLFLASLSLERFLIYKRKPTLISFSICCLCFTLACLIKVLPLIWLGLPLLFISTSNAYFFEIRSLKISLFRIFNNLISMRFVLFLFITLFCLISWYLYAYYLGISSGNSFGFWGDSSDRSSIKLILDFRTWIDLLIRIVIRNLALFGLPILIFGLLKNTHVFGRNLLLVGFFGVFLSTIFSMRSSSIHEYYQLPLQLYACPLMGYGMTNIKSFYSSYLLKKYLSKIFITLITFVSLIVLNFDYFAVEKSQSKIWMPLANEIRKTLPIDGKLVSVSGNDPTLLNLARRQGWLTSADKIDKTSLQNWSEKGASYIVGSLDWSNSYTPFYNQDEKNKVAKHLCTFQLAHDCPTSPHNIYMIPLSDFNK
tara:strand:- start:222 stop:1766 length:1545 start_codon:yes stop_codon:yes gene_type:complete